jgi:hypothetical protein
MGKLISNNEEIYLYISSDYIYNFYRKLISPYKLYIALPRTRFDENQRIKKSTNK